MTIDTLKISKELIEAGLSQKVSKNSLPDSNKMMKIILVKKVKVSYKK